MTMGLNDERRKEVGRLGETIAADFLIRKGFKVIERNYRRPWGEIDIIAEKNRIVRFVEVKSVSRETLPDVSRENDSYRPEEQVHPFKLRKVARTAEMYMNSNKDGREYQIDVIGVFLNMKTRKARCRLFENVN
jgi:putative endonuclease